jgi:histidinol-phosphate phosphatase family protein
MEAIISAGGKGTRLGGLASETPKCLMPAGGTTILGLQLEELARNGVEKATLLTGHLGEVVEDYLRAGTFPLEVATLRERESLGTAGGLAALRGALEAPAVFLYGDLVFSVDLRAMLEAHEASKALVTMLVHPNSHPYDSDLVLTDRDGKVLGLVGKSAERKGYYGNLVNAGVYILSPEALELVEPGKKSDFEKDILPPLIARGRAFGYRTSEYVKDMGTLERLEQVGRDLARGGVEARRLSNPQRAIFLDRDGTINRYDGLISRPGQLELLPGAAQAIRLVNDSGYLCLVASNQPAVARNLCTMEEEEEINRKLETLLGAEGAFLDDLRFCPHHPDSGYPGENAALKIDCDCRKPKIGMVAELAARYNVDLSKSWMIGDTSVDVQTAANAGMRSVLVSGGMVEVPRKYPAAPDALEDGLLEAVRRVLGSRG